MSADPMLVTTAPAEPGDFQAVPGEYALRLEGISKSFGEIRANENVTLRVRRGAIHGVVGENGAGKTTLMRIAYGFYRADAGRIHVDDARVDLTSPRVALGSGIAMVHQHSLLVDSLTVTENILLATDQTIPSFGPAQARIREIGQRFGLAVEPTRRVGQLSVAGKQRVEILKALYFDARIIILDEPTAVLTPQEARGLFAHLRTFAQQGKTILIITHKLPEVMAVTTDVSVMRAGRLVYEARTTETSEERIAQAMVGRSVTLRMHRDRTGADEAAQASSSSEPVLEVRGLTVADDRAVVRLRSVDLEVHAGEILGIAAVEGNGQSELVEAVTGLRRPAEGAVRVLGQDVTTSDPRKRREQGMRHIPEDRLQAGVNPSASVRENLICGRHYRPPLAGRWLMRSDQMQRYAAGLVERFAIVTPNVSTRVGALSGGNMQKVVIARELEEGARLIVAAQPTQGVDIGATEAIRTELLRMRDEGAAILLVSSELSEIVDLADRVVVLFGGEVAGRLSGDQIEEESLGLLMMGGRSGSGPADV